MIEFCSYLIYIDGLLFFSIHTLIISFENFRDLLLIRFTFSRDHLSFSERNRVLLYFMD